jgi:hypothetical protein
MALTLSQKLKIKAGSRITAINAPADFKKTLGPLPEGAKIVADAKAASQIHWFVKDRAQLEKELKDVLKLLRDGIILWIYYPKGTSKIQTDLTRDKGWDELMKHKHLHWLSLISFDDTWSAFALRVDSQPAGKKAKKPADRPILEWIDAEKKIVRLPDDVAAAFRENKSEAAYFNSLAFSHRKEYVEWIVTAKREETRKKRVEGMLEMLGQKRKNPNERS